MSRKFNVYFTLSYYEEVVLDDEELEGMDEDEIEDYVLDEALSLAGDDGNLDYGSVEVEEI